MDVNWDQLINILWLLIVFIAPAIIGLFKKQKDEDSVYENKNDLMQEVESLLGGREIKFDKLKEDSVAKPRVERKQTVKQKSKTQTHSSARQQNTKAPKVEVYVETPKDLSVKSVSTNTKSSSDLSINKVSKGRGKKEYHFVRNPKNIRNLLIWKEILGPPKALDPNPW